ncbi:hypothetical protein IP93_02978 [Lysobacter ruishenii]|uniref:Uncharacterized protein n=1 Tax=Aerolutibacter ruishenii TaxID=686800 RepID=A0A562LFG3_9GAMM|nr:hypothetical protein IP93_02978 [Lysobacter ruishenii]
MDGANGTMVVAGAAARDEGLPECRPSRSCRADRLRRVGRAHLAA